MEMTNSSIFLFCFHSIPKTGWSCVWWWHGPHWWTSNRISPDLLRLHVQHGRCPEILELCQDLFRPAWQDVHTGHWIAITTAISYVWIVTKCSSRSGIVFFISAANITTIIIVISCEQQATSTHWEQTGGSTFHHIFQDSCATKVLVQSWRDHPVLHLALSSQVLRCLGGKLLDPFDTKAYTPLWLILHYYLPRVSRVCTLSTITVYAIYFASLIFRESGLQDIFASG